MTATSEMTADTISARLRGYLYFTAAVTGAAILIVEILGAKMLAPYFGTSHFVWTAQIAVTLIALAAGYYVGGWWVDRAPRLGHMYGAIAGAALYLCLTVPTVERVSRGCLHLQLALGSLAASAFLFLVPLALLAMTVPFFVRMLTRSVGNVGGSVGRLTAISTIGSVLGVVLIGYVLVPLLPNSVTMLTTAGVLLAVAGGYFLVAGRKQAVFVGATALIGLGAGTLGAEPKLPFAEGVEVFRCNSNFGLLQVVESEGRRSRFYRGHSRYFLNDYLMQNIYDPAGKRSLVISTYVLDALARGYTPELRDALCIGMGVGVLPMELAREGTRVEAVEINPELPFLAERWFDFEPSRVRVAIGDGRHFVNTCRRQYDTVILDAFLGDSMPTHLMTREAFGEMRRVLRPGGTLVIHTFGNMQRDRSFLTFALGSTLSDVFRTVRVHHDPGEPDIHSVFFVASDDPELALRGAPEWERIPSPFRRVVEAVLTNRVPRRRQPRSHPPPDHGRCRDALAASDAPNPKRALPSMGWRSLPNTSNTSRRCSRA
jgi:SAM-dependent methyltransferase